MTIDALRTPDAHFENLPDWPYAPNYIDDLPGYEGLRAHYVDEGPKDAKQTFLCLHGEPSWGYLYRHMIPHFVDSSARVIAPDFFGFGRSDKPAAEADYTFHFHRNHIMRLIERLDLNNITLVCQDWGGLIGLTLPVDMQERFSRLIVMNTTLVVGRPATKGFDQWLAYVQKTPDLPVGSFLKSTTPHLTDAEVAAYDAPYPDSTFKAGARQFPRLVMTDPDMEGVGTSKRAFKFWTNEWKGESYMAIGMKDTILGPPVMRHLASKINGCPEPLEIADGGHFVQEWGDIIAPAALKHFGDI